MNVYNCHKFYISETLRNRALMTLTYSYRECSENAVSHLKIRAKITYIILMAYCRSNFATRASIFFIEKNVSTKKILYFTLHIRRKIKTSGRKININNFELAICAARYTLFIVNFYCP